MFVCTAAYFVWHGLRGWAISQRDGGGWRGGSHTHIPTPSHTPTHCYWYSLYKKSFQLHMFHYGLSLPVVAYSQHAHTLTPSHTHTHTHTHTNTHTQTSSVQPHHALLENPESETRWYFKYFLGKGQLLHPHTNPHTHTHTPSHTHIHTHTHTHTHTHPHTHTHTHTQYIATTCVTTTPRAPCSSL